MRIFNIIFGITIILFGILIFSGFILYEMGRDELAETLMAAGFFSFISVGLVIVGLLFIFNTFLPK